MAKSWTELKERMKVHFDDLDDFSKKSVAKQKLAHLMHSGKAKGALIANKMRTLNMGDDMDQEDLEALHEVLSKDAEAGDWIHDFVHSDNAKFEGKSKKERIKMALGAYYGKQNEKNGITESDQEHHYQVTYYHKDGKASDSSKRFAEKEKADAHAEKGNSIDKVGGTYKVHKVDSPITEGRNEDDVPFDKPYKTITSPDTKDKSGATHTPMSRARHIARMARDAMVARQTPKPVTEAKYAGLEKEKTPKAAPTAMVKTSKTAVAGDTVEGWDHPTKPIKEGKLTYKEFAMMLEYEVGKGGVYRHQGTYGSDYAKAEREKDEKGFDDESKETSGKRGPKVGSKRGPRANLGNSKLHTK